MNLKPNPQQTLESLYTKILNASNRVYKTLGSGHSEIIYHKALEVELRDLNISYSTKAPISIYYKNIIVGYSECDLIIHSLLNNITSINIIVELKATTYAPRSSEVGQLKSYMKTMNCKHGILINFPQPSSSRNPDKVDIIPFGIFPDLDLN